MGRILDTLDSRWVRCRTCGSQTPLAKLEKHRVYVKSNARYCRNCKGWCCDMRGQYTNAIEGNAKRGNRWGDY